ncbi:non-hydrolyzing UDP-N-acetylglucosamine 2-epimerase [Spiribacter vilamensis]|uniref:non-hydrolyzing UDP-N-acetylglucosamine 2-epimerase n=1 Tax=Spiribacter vilamensis TaxID=531306 RepID=UPI0023B2DE52|nr:UDP-N-acetylglucosamine 2-epimerase (non-hydrolyzing) [Spiribacter vilamensis]
MTVIGARPQFIKAASVSRAIHAKEGLAEVLVHTGQHFDANMSDVFFDELGIPAPDYHLGVSGGGHGAMTGRMLERLEELLEKEAPDWVLVYGDTNSTLAGALAAAKLHIPVAHVEAGLRSFNRRMPEELNRILTDQLADILFTPTDTASDNLRREGVSESRIAQVGDVMFDAALFYAERAAERSAILNEHGLNKGEYVLATIHRAENTDDPERLGAIMTGLEAAAQERPVVLPLHPRTRAAMAREGFEPQHIRLIEPVGYLDMVALESNAAVIATDSGGVQKEAYFHGVPCVTLRDETEWVELVEMGWNELAPPGSADIALLLRNVVERDIGRKENRDKRNIYGEGETSTHITSTLSEEY